MESICHELQIPKRFIKESDDNRFLVRAHKSWIKQLGQYGKVGSFIDNASNATNNWQQCIITVSVSVLKFTSVPMQTVLIKIFCFETGLSETFTQSNTITTIKRSRRHQQFRQ